MFGNRRQQREDQLIAMRAEVLTLQSRLAADVSTLQAADDRLCAQALADAAERNNAAGALLSSATTPGELVVARRAVIEGLMATRVVREKQGLALGADLPPLDASPLSSPATVVVGDETHVAHPDYHPDRPHYFGGGRVAGGSAPAGYYRTPFWQKALAVGGAVMGAEMIGNVLGDVFDSDQGYGGWDGDDGGGWGGDGPF